VIANNKQGLHSLLIRLSNMNDRKTDLLQSIEKGGV
jgi:hypothetical protein